MFIEMNSFGSAYYYLKNIIASVVLCRREKAKEIKTFNTLLTILGISIVFLCNAILIPFVFFVQNRLTSLWNQIKSDATSSSNMMKEMCLERLKIVHQYEEFGEDNKEETQNYNTRRKNDKVKFDYRKKYILRIIILLFFGSTFYIISNFVFFSPMQIRLKNRPDVLYYLILSRIELAHLSFWSRQILIEKFYLDLKSNPSWHIPLNTDYEVNLEYSAHEVISNTRKILKEKYSELLGKSAEKVIFEQHNSTLSVFNYGLFSGMHNLVFDSFYIAQISGVDIVSMYLQFFTKMTELGLETKNIFNDIVRYSRNLIIADMENFIYFAAFFSILLILICLIVFYPFLRGEGKKIIWIEEISEIIISSTVQYKGK